MRNLVKILGSLSFALWLLGVLVAVLTVSTVLESAYGTPFVQKFFYTAGWFDFFLALLAVNILFSALSRWPYKLHHTGFLITHTGILLLLAGSLMTRLIGIDGQMALREGEKKDYMTQQAYQLAVHLPENKVKLWDLKSLADKSHSVLPLDNPKCKLILERIEDGVLFTPDVGAGDGSSEKNHAVQFTLHSEMAKLNESFWLVENSSDPSFLNRMTVGLADIELKEGKAGAKQPTLPDGPVTPQLKLTQKNSSKNFIVPLNTDRTEDASSKEMDLKVTDITYFSNARVNEQNELVNAPGEKLNPAVRFTLEDGTGHRQQRTLFKLFPDFESIHGRKNDLFSDIKVELIAPESQLADPTAKKSGLTFYFSKEGWTYESRSKTETLTGNVKTGEDQPTGWMDFTFHVDQVLDNAVIERKMVTTGTSKKGDVALLLSLSENGQSLGSQWVVPDEPVTFPTSEGPLTAAVGTKTLMLPFQLKLIDFRKKDYPGTNNAASYESDAVLEDPAEQVTIQKRIWMNHPLDYKGYRIFQSSYIQDPEAGETSIFTIAKDPGVLFIYSGAIVMFIGAFCVFYVKPFSYLNARSSHASTKK